MHSEIDEKEIPIGVAIFGADENEYFLSYFDERGVSRKYEVSVKEGKMIWKRDDEKLAQCMTFTLQNGGAQIVCKGPEVRAGGAWGDDLQLTYDRQI